MGYFICRLNIQEEIMIKKFFILITMFSILFMNGILFSSEKTNKLEPPPSTIKLKVKSPENFKQALKRVSDYLILNMILPPVIDRENIKSQLYGKFKKDVEKYIADNKVNLRKISKMIEVKLNNKKENLENIKSDVYKELTVKEKSNKTVSKKPEKSENRNINIKKSKNKEKSSVGYYIALTVVLVILAGGVFLTKGKKS